MTKTDNDNGVVGGPIERWDVGDDRQLTRAEIAKETGLTKQAVDKRIASGKRGAELLDVSRKVASTRKLETPISGWSDEQLYWLRRGLTPYGGAYDGKPAEFEDDGRAISFEPRRTQFYSSTGKDVD